MKLRDILDEINIEVPGPGPSPPNKFTKNVWDKDEQEYYIHLNPEAIKKYLKSHPEYMDWEDEDWDRILEDDSFTIDLEGLEFVKNNADAEILIDNSLRFYLGDY